MTNAIVIPQFGDLPGGEMNLTVTYTDTAATATATAPGVQLRRGSRYRLQTCVWSKAAGSAPASVCQERMLDARAWRATASAPAPTAVMEMARRVPPPGNRPRLRSAMTWRSAPSGRPPGRRPARTVNASYRECSAAIVDTLGLYDRVEKTYSNRLPISSTASPRAASSR